MSTKNRTRRTTTRNIRFPNQMIEQINIALDQKGSGNFSAWVIEACRRRLCSEKRVSPEANKEKSDSTKENITELTEISRKTESDQIEAI